MLHNKPEASSCHLPGWSRFSSCTVDARTPYKLGPEAMRPVTHGPMIQEPGPMVDAPSAHCPADCSGGWRWTPACGLLWRCVPLLLRQMAPAKGDRTPPASVGQQGVTIDWTQDSSAEDHHCWPTRPMGGTTLPPAAQTLRQTHGCFQNKQGTPMPLTRPASASKMVPAWGHKEIEAKRLA
jgi:hypothetical protein